MSTDYNYDDQGQFFPYFILTVTGLFTVPITYSLLKPSREPENTAPRIQSEFEPEQKDLIDKQRWKQKRRNLKLKRMATAAIGWVVMAWMGYLMLVTARTTPKIWNPYEILGLTTSANEKQIKSHYRKLSLTQHPDKVRLDPVNNVTAESVNDHWVEITKAFKALTDEDIRKNYELYGHPDGKQSFSIGIALPKFIVTDGNGKYVLLVYAALIGVLLPYFVGKWWYGTQKMTKDGILISSAGKLFTEYREDMVEGAILGALSNGDEYEAGMRSKKSHEDSSKIETRILEGTTGGSKTTLTQADKEKLLGMEDEKRRRILSLLWAYLNRVQLDDPTLDEEKYEVAPIALKLNESFTNMTLAFANTQPLLASYRIAQGLVQAMGPDASPLLQLPYFTPQIIQAISEQTADATRSVQSFMEIPDKKRRELALRAGLGEKQYAAAVQVATQLPVARIEKAFFKVTGEKFLTPGSLIQLVVKLRIIPPGTSQIPAVNELDLEDVDPKEGDLDALHGRKKKTIKDAKGKIITTAAEVPVQPSLAHAPYFARDHSPQWRVFLAENKSGKIAVPPFSFSTFDKPLFNEDGTPTYNVQTLKMQFQAPPQAGNYPFTMHLVCDSYIGMDSTVDVIMAVEEMAKASEIEEEEEISEPDEDSLAGQMNALRGSEAGAAKAPRKRITKEESSGSDTDGDEDSEEDTDTDTSTDEE